LLDDLSIGSGHDVERATAIARALVEEFGMGGEDLGVRRFAAASAREHPPELSDATRGSIERSIKAVLDTERERAKGLIETHRSQVLALRELLLEKKILDREAFAPIADATRPAGAKRRSDA
jgi:cell division protease FtsH